MPQDDTRPEWTLEDGDDWGPNDPLPQLRDLSCCADAVDVLEAIEAKHPEFANKRYNSARLRRERKEKET